VGHFVSDRRAPALSVKARWALLPGAILAENTALDSAGGVITRVGRPRGGERDLGDVLLTPGLVDAHVHLELSALRPGRASGGFTRWALGLAVRRALSSRAALAEAAAEALEALSAEGVTCVGELTTTGASLRALAARGMAGTWYREMIDVRPTGGRERVRKTAARSEAEARRAGLKPGLFPHAPYSVSAGLCASAARVARASGLAFAIHAAEHRDEMDLFLRGRGPLRHLRRLLGAERIGREGRVSPVEWLDRVGALFEGATIVHATYASERDVGLMRRRGASVVVCPRSATYLEGGPVDVQRLLRAGITVGIGTDSPVSGGTPSLREDMRALEARGVSPREILRAATESGAAALGLAGTTGSLVPGARADLSAFDVGVSGDPLACAVSDARSRTVMPAIPPA
jgi:cytosine/adenosine deaminase-related metal-dependent hydrolase